MLNFVLMLSAFCRGVSLAYLWYLSHNYTRASQQFHFEGISY